MKETDYSRIIKSITTTLQTNWLIQDYLPGDQITDIILSVYLLNEYFDILTMECKPDLTLIWYRNSLSVLKRKQIVYARLNHPLCAYSDIDEDIYNLLLCTELCFEQLQD